MGLRASTTVPLNAAPDQMKGPAMSSRLDRTELVQRFRDQASDLILQMAILLQGGILSGAAFSLIGIFQTQDDMVIRLILWLTSVIIGLLMFFRLCHRALFLMSAGVEILFVLPIMCMLQIIPFAVLSSTALGPAGWRYWYVADTAVFALGVVANWLALRGLKADQYAKNMAGLFARVRVIVRQQCVEGIAATLLTFLLTIWILAVPPDWPYATIFVSVHLALTVISSLIIVREDSREMAALRERFAR